MLASRFLFQIGCCTAIALILHGQDGSRTSGFAVRGWTTAAPGYPVAAIRDVAAAPDGFYAAADVSSVYNRTAIVSDATSDVWVGRFDAAGELAWSRAIEGAGRDVVRAVAVDQAGYVYLAGSTQSADFPRLNSLEQGVAEGSQAAFLWKIDPVTDTVV